MKNIMILYYYFAPIYKFKKEVVSSFKERLEAYAVKKNKDGTYNKREAKKVWNDYKTVLFQAGSITKKQTSWKMPNI